MEEEQQLIIEGRNAVREAFRAGRTIDKVYVQDGLKDGIILVPAREDIDLPVEEHLIVELYSK